MGRRKGGELSVALRALAMASPAENHAGGGGKGNKEHHVLLMNPRSSVVHGLRHFYPYGKLNQKLLYFTECELDVDGLDANNYRCVGLLVRVRCTPKHETISAHAKALGVQLLAIPPPFFFFCRRIFQRAILASRTIVLGQFPETIIRRDSYNALI